MATFFRPNSPAHESVEKLFQLMEEKGIAVEAFSGNVRLYVKDSDGNSVITTVVDAESDEEILSFPPTCEWRLRVLFLMK